jgi:Flp pilus assembly pilin Flp
MLKLAKKFWNDERGLETAEYAVMTALIVALLVAAVTALSSAIQGRLNETATVITGLPD